MPKRPKTYGLNRRDNVILIVKPFCNLLYVIFDSPSNAICWMTFSIYIM